LRSTAENDRAIMSLALFQNRELHHAAVQSVLSEVDTGSREENASK
jgi:hypothetical protein